MAWQGSFRWAFFLCSSDLPCLRPSAAVLLTPMRRSFSPLRTPVVDPISGPSTSSMELGGSSRPKSVKASLAWTPPHSQCSAGRCRRPGGRRDKKAAGNIAATEPELPSSSSSALALSLPPLSLSLSLFCLCFMCAFPLDWRRCYPRRAPIGRESLSTRKACPPPGGSPVRDDWPRLRRADLLLTPILCACWSCETILDHAALGVRRPLVHSTLCPPSPRDALHLRLLEMVAPSSSCPRTDPSSFGRYEGPFLGVRRKVLMWRDEG